MGLCLSFFCSVFFELTRLLRLFLATETNSNETLKNKVWLAFQLVSDVAVLNVRFL